MQSKIEEILGKLEGFQTVETASRELKMTRQSTINLLSKLKKQGNVTVSGGGKQPRLYKITIRKQRKRDLGMFDIINKYSPMKLNPWYDHQVHGAYGPEEALIDAIQTRSFRAILASLRLFQHIKDWKKVYYLSKKNNAWRKVCALYDIARIFFKVKKMPKRYYHQEKGQWEPLTELKNKNNFPGIQNKWNIYIPFNYNDIREIK